MGFLNNVINGIAGAYAGFREGYLHADTPDAGLVGGGYDEWGVVEARRLRYALLWAYDQNDVYSHIHAFARQYKAIDGGMYKAVRPIFNPANRVNTFGAVHVHGGTLDADAGDGDSVPSALPIATDNDDLRPAIARLWKDSRWQTGKYVLGRYGTMLGDVAIKLCDDPKAGRVVEKAVHPKHVRWVDWLDRHAGTVRSYILDEVRYDPRVPSPSVALAGVASPFRTVTYTERVTLQDDGATVTFETFLDGEPFPWQGHPATWAESYGFVPLVLIQHDNVGLDWGMAEVHPQLAMIREVNDLASMIGDQVRKAVKCPLAISGIASPNDLKIAMPDTTPTRENPQPIRTEVPLFLLRDPAAKVTPLIGDLNLGHALDHLKELIAELQRELPELNSENWRAHDASGRAIRVAREPVEVKVRERRSGYDDGQALAQKMAVIMGAMGGYPAYAKFRNATLLSDSLDHAIGDRPVFAADALDRIEVRKAVYDMGKVAVSEGLPLETFLRREDDWSDDDIDALRVDQAAEAADPEGDGLITTQHNVAVGAAQPRAAGGATPAEAAARLESGPAGPKPPPATKGNP